MKGQYDEPEILDFRGVFFLGGKRKRGHLLLLVLMSKGTGPQPLRGPRGGGRALVACGGEESPASIRGTKNKKKQKQLA